MMTHGALALAPDPPAPSPAPPTVALPQEEMTPTPPPTSAVSMKSEAAPLEIFRGILSSVAESDPAVASIFEHAVVLELSPSRARLGFPQGSFAGMQAKEPEALEVVTRAVRAHFGAPTEVAVDLSVRAASRETVAVADAARRKDAMEKAKAEAAAHPLVVEALRVFRGQLLEVRLREEEEC